jgi:hypothetical protein
MYDDKPFKIFIRKKYSGYSQCPSGQLINKPSRRRVRIPDGKKTAQGAPRGNALSSCQGRV